MSSQCTLRHTALYPHTQDSQCRCTVLFACDRMTDPRHTRVTPRTRSDRADNRTHRACEMGASAAPQRIQTPRHTSRRLHGSSRLTTRAHPVTIYRTHAHHAHAWMPSALDACRRDGIHPHSTGTVPTEGADGMLMCCRHACLIFTWAHQYRARRHTTPHPLAISNGGTRLLSCWWPCARRRGSRPRRRCWCAQIVQCWSVRWSGGRCWHRLT